MNESQMLRETQNRHATEGVDACVCVCVSAVRKLVLAFVQSAHFSMF